MSVPERFPRPSRRPVIALGLAWLLVTAAATGCSLNKLVADSMAGALADQERAMNAEESPRMARAAAPGALKMLDGFIVSSPENVQLLLAGAKQNSTFAFGFAEEEDPAWARALYERAYLYGRRALREEDPDLDNALFGIGRDGDARLAALEADDDALVPLYWATFALGGVINVSRDDTSLLAELPLVVKVMERLVALIPEHENGGPHLFLAVYYGSRGSMLGGDVKKSAAHFDALWRITGGRYLIAEVLRARTLCVALGEKDPARARTEFVQRLDRVLDAPATIDAPNMLVTAIAKERARKLKPQLDDLILPPLPEDEPAAPLHPAGKGKKP